MNKLLPIWNGESNTHNAPGMRILDGSAGPASIAFWETPLALRGSSDGRPIKRGLERWSCLALFGRASHIRPEVETKRTLRNGIAIVLVVDSTRLNSDDKGKHRYKTSAGFSGV